MRFSFLLLFVLLPSGYAAGQGNRPDVLPDTVYALPGIEVSSTRFGDASATKALRISVIDQSLVAATAALNAGELLTRASPLFIRRYGAGLSLPVLRGNNAAQTLLLIDGVPLTDPQLGQIDLSLIPASLLQNVSIMHGAAGALYGSSSMAGVINFESRKPPEIPASLHTTVGAGAFGKRYGAISFSTKKSRLGSYVALSHHTEKGDFPYLNPSLFPPRTTRRDSAAREQTSLFGKVDLTHNRSRTTVAGWISESDRHLPGLATTTPQGERQWDDLARGWVQHIRQFPDGVLTLRTAYQQSRLRYLHPILEIDQASQTNSLSFTSEWAQPLSASWSLDAGFDGTLRKANHPALQAGAREFQSGLFIKGHYRRDRLNVFPTWRLDATHPVSHNRVTALSPSLGINLQPFKSPALHLKALAGRSHRTPTFNDRFWQPGGNPDLLSESGWNYEAGIHFALGGATLESTLYRQHLQNQITWQPTENGFWSPVNLRKTRTIGTETSLQKNWTISSNTAFTVSLIHTYTDARDQSATASTFGKPLRYVPKHQLKNRVALNYNSTHWHVSADLFVRYTDRRFITTDASQSLPSYTTLDAQIQNTWITDRASIQLGLVLENATDQTYEIIKGYPTPPRILRLVLSIAWPGAGADP